MGVPQGDPDGIYRGIFKFDETHGATAENAANYHVCVDPSYSKNVWIEIDGNLGGASGTPTLGPGARGNPPNYLFDRDKQQDVVMLDNSPSCTTGNDPWDHSGPAHYFYIGAWVQPTEPLSCATLGTKLNVVSKWGSGSDCSYKLWLESVDSNGGACDDSEMVYQVRAAFTEDAGGWDCSGPCVVKYPTSVAANDVIVNAWTHIAVLFDPVTVPSRARIMVNGKHTVTVPASEICEDGTNITDSYTIHNSAADLVVGNESHLATDAFRGGIGGVTIIDSPHQNFMRTLVLNHLDAGGTGIYTNFSGGDDHYLHYAVRAFTAEATPTPGADVTPPSIDTVNKRYSASFNFDGKNDYAQILPSIWNTPDRVAMNTLLVEAWIRPTVATGGGVEQTIAAKWNYNNDVGCTDDLPNSAFRLFLDTSGRVNFWLVDSTGVKQTVVGSTVLGDNKWYHVAGLISNSAPSYLATANAMYVMVDGKPDVVAPTVFTDLQLSQTMIVLGATTVTSPGTNCTFSGYKHYFKGNIDEFRVAVPRGGSNDFEAFNPGVVINEVNFKTDTACITTSSSELIELYAFADLGHDIDMKQYTLGLCSQGVKEFVFDEGCANCADKIMNPGDIAIIHFATDVQPIGGWVDTSCNGPATTCDWYASNTLGTGTLQFCDMNDAADGVILYNRNEPSTANEKFASAIDAVIWGADQGACQDNVSSDTHGLWEDSDFLLTNLITDGNQRSLCLDIDGDNGQGIKSWQQCSSTIGALNSTRTTSIQLINLKAKLENGGAKVTWKTGAEKNVMGFNILRANTEFDFYQQINTTLIDAQGLFGTGSDYEYIDSTATAPKYYKLQEIDIDGMISEFGPVHSGKNGQSISKGGSGTKSDGSDDVNNADGGASAAAASAGGCGRIAATDSMAGATLSFLMVALIYLSTRTYLLEMVMPIAWRRYRYFFSDGNIASK